MANAQKQDINLGITRYVKECAVFSSGEYRLLEVAASLYNEEVKVNLWNLVNGLDSKNLRLVLEAIAISRGDTAAEDAMRERMEAFSRDLFRREGKPAGGK